jgi:hypothetical protein
MLAVSFLLPLEIYFSLVNGVSPMDRSEVEEASVEAPFASERNMLAFESI